ncbi:MAG: MFS transporter [Rhodospirillaceae bacterium]|jgi:MFS family permease|nr:MFS transporter [Rhodospirillaceae bacterium]MBT5943281.1 MFS transporter [Rhodospirillaceae bacterium]MBT6536036.1 MFS transporter [Rhodospirillaceae bacterium]
MTTSAGLRDLLTNFQFVRIWLVGIFSGIARWLEMLVAGVYAFDTTGSPFLVALLVILRMMPLVAFGSIVGTFADRLSPKIFMCVTMLGAMLVSGTVFVLFLIGHDSYWLVAFASFVSGLVWTTDMPLRRRMLGDVAGMARVAQAMSLDAATNNATRMLGPLFGGLIYQWQGAGGAYMLSAALYAACVIVLVFVSAKLVNAGALRPASRALDDLRAGFAYVARDRDVLRIMLVTIIFNLWGFPFLAMIPVVGRDELQVSASIIGGLTALEGGGAFLGSVIIASRVRIRSYRRLYYFGLLGYLFAAFTAGWMVDVVPMALALVVVGLCASGFSTMQSTLIYTVAPPEMRGRLFGVLVICIGSGLIGFANIGLMGEWFGGSTAMRIVAAEGLIPLLFIGFTWRQLWSRGGYD